MREGAHVARRELVGRREASQFSQAWRIMIQKAMSLNTGGCARSSGGTRRQARGLAACGPRRAASRRIAPPALTVIRRSRPAVRRSRPVNKKVASVGRRSRPGTCPR